MNSHLSRTIYIHRIVLTDSLCPQISYISRYVTCKNTERKKRKEGGRKKKETIGLRKKRGNCTTFFAAALCNDTANRLVSICRPCQVASSSQEKRAQITRHFCISVDVSPRCLLARTIWLKAHGAATCTPLNFNLIALKVTEYTALSFEFTVLSHIPTARTRSRFPRDSAALPYPEIYSGQSRD